MHLSKHPTCHICNHCGSILSLGHNNLMVALLNSRSKVWIHFCTKATFPYSWRRYFIHNDNEQVSKNIMGTMLKCIGGWLTCGNHKTHPGEVIIFLVTIRCENWKLLLIFSSFSLVSVNMCICNEGRINQRLN